MGARSAVVETLQRPAIIGIAQRGSRPEQLVERQGAMEDVAAGEAEHLLEVEGAERLAADDARLEPWCVAVDRLDHQIGHALAMVAPRRAVGQLRRDMLAEQARDMRAP